MGSIAVNCDAKKIARMLLRAICPMDFALLQRSDIRRA
jgi:hypothetical protein